MSGEPALTDEQIHTMTPAERRDLIRRLSRPAPESPPRGGLLRGQSRVVLLAAAVIVMLPWIGYLAVVLPNRYDARHWDLTWAGFDLLLAAMLAATAVFALLRRQLLVLTSFASGVLLVCDAWFDVLTARRADLPESIATAFLLELPLAALLILGTLRLLRANAQRLWALEPGTPLWRLELDLP